MCDKPKVYPVRRLRRFTRLQITACQWTMSSQNWVLTGQILGLPDMVFLVVVNSQDVIKSCCNCSRLVEVLPLAKCHWLLNKLVGWLIDWMNEWSESTLTKNNLTAPRILHICCKVQNSKQKKKRTNHTSLLAHPAKLLSFIVISSLDATQKWRKNKIVFKGV